MSLGPSDALSLGHSLGLTRNLDLVGGVLVLVVDLQHHHHHLLVNLVDKLLLAKIT